MARLKRLIYEQLAVEAWTRAGLSPVNRFIVAVILLSVFAAVLQTEPTLNGPYSGVFAVLDHGFLSIFIVEYVLRVWTKGCHPDFTGIRGRLRYMVTWPALVDLAAILPFLVGAVGSEAYLLRIMRLLRIAALMRLGRFSRALKTLAHAIAERRFELFIAFGVAGMTVFVAAVFVYFAESGAQPEAFGSIPRALWWGVATITTVGYGDVSPVTPLGKIFAALFMLGGIAVIALPAGIFAAALSDLLQERRRESRARRERRAEKKAEEEEEG